MSQESLLPKGHLLQMGKYRVERQIASGGFGNTYEVQNVHFDERYALKEFFMRGINEREESSKTVSVSNSDNVSQFNSQLEKFKKEARRLRKLHNPHIVQVHDLFEENNTAYYVMDYVDGESLSTRLKRTGTPLNEDEVLSILNQMLEALDIVHAKGIWHLDIKPANIMINSQGNAVLIDFGASKQMSASESYTATTTAMCYTPGYAPLEQIDQSINLTGPWTDLYALGATMYNLLTTKRPPSISEVGTMNFAGLEHVSDKTKHLIRWMMTPNRRQRPQSVAEVREFLAKPFVPEAYSDETVVGQEADNDETVVGQDVKKQEHSTGHQPRQEKPVRSSFVQEVPEADIEEESWFQSNKSAILAFIVAAVVGGAVFFYFSRSNTDTPSPEPVVQQEVRKAFYFKSALGICSYTGPVDENEKPHGIGEASFTDDRLYKGPFVHGAFEGEGAYFRYENGDTFEGSFLNNSFAKGRYTLKEDGSYFVGTFKQGQPDKGKWYNKNGQAI